MSSLSRPQVVAFPRGRPTPYIIPLCRPHFPSPLWQRGLLYIIGGKPIQWIAERWQAADVWACPTESSPDPERPGQCISVRMVDATSNTEIRPVDERSLKSLLDGLTVNDYHRIASGLKPTLAPRRSGPQPTLTWHLGYLVRSRPYVFVGERWKADDAYASVSECFPDSDREGVMLTTRLLSLDGELVKTASCGEFASALPSAYQLPCQALRVSE